MAQTTRASADHTTATWSEMQNTLEEVELSAASGSTAFSASHAAALEELRRAQVGLADAWARSEAEQESDGETENAQQSVKRPTGSSTTGTAAIAAAVPNKHASLEEETEADIAMARRRREANDRYFERVRRGVVDVVAQLDVVAQKMRGVEQEAQDLWSERDSFASENDGNDDESSNSASTDNAAGASR